MGPARFHCATLLSVQDQQKLDDTTTPTKIFHVRSGIRTHAHRSGLRPERSALDLSAILTVYQRCQGVVLITGSIPLGAKQFVQKFRPSRGSNPGPLG